MISIRAAGAALVLLSSVRAGALAQQGPCSCPSEPSAPISNIGYQVTFDQALASRRLVRVAMSFTPADTTPVVLSLPAWTPGSYEIDYFSRWVTDFSAVGDGKPLAWDKLDYDTWRIRTNGAKRLTVSFQYHADSLDNANSWAQRDFLLFNGTNLFLHPEGRGFDFPATVTVTTAPDWRIVTGMTPAARPHTYTATNYHDLVDMPFFIGRFDEDSTRTAEGVWLRYVSYPEGSVPVALRAKLLTQLSRIMSVQAQVFGEVPFRTYSLMQIADSSFGAIVGLEHQNSHVDVTSPFAIGQPVLTSVYAHEIFHAWNVKRLRPADLWPYQYAREQPTPWLWVSEGITDYYADLSELRAGVIDSVGFFELTAAKIAEVGNAAPVALSDASLSTWVHPIADNDIYYPKGSLAGFMLDIMIRDASDNHRSLDDVMRQLYRQDYAAGKGFTADDWWTAVSSAAGGKSFADFNARYVDGRDSYPWASILPLAGLRIIADTMRVPRLGVTTDLDSAGIHVTAVDPGSTAEEAGVEPGDYLTSVGGIRVDLRGFAQAFREKYRTRGAPVPIVVEREGRTVTLTGKLQFDERVQVQLAADPKATPKAARVLAGILHGTVDQ